MTAVRVAALTGGKNVPSARFRVRELIAPLADAGVDLTEYVPAIDKYPPRSQLARPFWLVGALLARVPGVVGSHQHDVTLLQRELISTLPTLEGLTQRPRVLDVDDAIFLHRDGTTARRLARQVDAIVCGNAYLADWFGQHHTSVAVVPTGIDTRRFVPGRPGEETDTVVVGWTGSCGNLRYLEAIEPALAKAMTAVPQLELHVVCDAAPHLPQLPKERVRFITWRPEVEVAAVQAFDIGIMPLADGPWEAGKCAFKLLQYLACEVAVVASPVGANRTLLNEADVGRAADSQTQWGDALVDLAQDPTTRRACGQTGRQLMQKRYDTRVVAVELARVLQRFA